MLWILQCYPSAVTCMGNPSLQWKHLFYLRHVILIMRLWASWIYIFIYIYSNQFSFHSFLISNSKQNSPYSIKCSHFIELRCDVISFILSLTYVIVFTDWQLSSAMSRFFATGSDSESEESSSADEITPKAPGTTFKQSVQFVLNPIITTENLLFGLISHISIVFTGHCCLVMMRRTPRGWCAAPKTKG